MSTGPEPPEGYTLGTPPTRGAPLPEMVMLIKGEWAPIEVSLSPGSQRKLLIKLPGSDMRMSVHSGNPNIKAWRPATGDTR